MQQLFTCHGHIMPCLVELLYNILLAGRHTVEIQVAGSQIEGSPFYVDVFDLNSIRLDNFRHGIVGEPAGFSGNRKF